MEDTTATETAPAPKRGFFTPTDGFWNIGGWGFYLEGESWNGWSVPYFDLGTCGRLVQEVNEMCFNTGDTDTRLSLHGGAFPAWGELADGQVLRHEMATLEVEGVTYYALGGWAFTWAKVHTEHRDDLVALAPEGTEWGEIAFEALNRWHASIDTGDDMGLELSSTLDEIQALAQFVQANSPYLGDPLPYWNETDAYAVGVSWLEEYRDYYPEIWERVGGAWLDKWNAPRLTEDNLRTEGN